MKRRSTAVSGWVRFPIDNPAWRNSEEGGMVVKLVVCDKPNDGFGLCGGAQVVDMLTESLVGDDRRARPQFAAHYDSIAAIKDEETALATWEAFHYPNVHRAEASSDYLSRDYLAALVLGTTGWSGWSDTEQDYWICRFEDLTPEGQALYRQLEALYAGCELHLLTFLDT